MLVTNDHTWAPILDEGADKKVESNGADEVTDDEDAGPRLGDDIEDGGEDAETEVQRDKDSTSGEVAQSKHCWPRHCWSQERLKIVLTEQQLWVIMVVWSIDHHGTRVSQLSHNFVMMTIIKELSEWRGQRLGEKYFLIK